MGQRRTIPRGGPATRGLKGRVHRALRGEAITGETLNWFIDAFYITGRDDGDSATAGRGQTGIGLRLSTLSARRNDCQCRSAIG
jgi:hypothetical protein